jgi:class 3 adenylate cyclase
MLARRWFLLLALALAWQQPRAAVPGDLQDVDTLNIRSLANRSTTVPGMGNEVPGMAITDLGTLAVHTGDDSSFALRSFVDTAWIGLDSAESTTGTGTGVFWLRARFFPDRTLSGPSLVLSLDRNVPVEIFLNGDPVFRSDGGTDTAHQRLSGPFLVPLALRHDGRPEVLALRISGVDAATAWALIEGISLHLPALVHRNQQSMVRYGVFIGVNVIILVLALVIWAFERHEKRWLYLALLSLVAAVNNFAVVGGLENALGLPGSLTNSLVVARIILMPWPLYLLILTLGSIYGQVSRRRRRWQSIAVVAATIALVILAASTAMRMDGSGQNITISSSKGITGWLLIILLLIVGGVMAWFMGAMVRLGFKVLRAKGYERWVGAGALASSLLSFFLQFLSSIDALSPGLSSWLKLLGEFCAGIGVPLSVAIYLAIRTAHHGRLVARQRDELDAEVKERTAELSHEKERTEELLLNILPAEVAEELKNTGKAQARHFDQVSVLFTDFQGFTSLSSTLSPEALLDELNACFEGFDAIITRRGIEKIKTIGDAYMCATGLNATGHDGPANLVWAALEMQDFLARRKRLRDAAGLPGFTMRAGIHTGPVVAGIVGVKKFQYDIWGDTVNTASRMESNGEVGRVNISETTYLLVRDTVVSSQLSGEPQTTENQQRTAAPAFLFTPRGNLPVKGKGELAMYFVRRA